MFQNVGLWGNDSDDGAVPPPPPRAEQLLFSNTRLHQMFQLASIPPGREAMTSKVRSSLPKGYGVTDLHLFMPHFICWEDGRTSGIEEDCPNNATVYSSINVGGIFYQGATGGQAGALMTPGIAGKWMNYPTAPGFAAASNMNIQIIHVGPTNGVRPVGFTRMTNQNEVARWDAAPNFSFLTGSTITNNATGRFYGPCCGVAKGNDGRPVIIIMPCTSLDLDRDETASLSDTRANLGPWERGLDEDIIGLSLPYANFAVPGSRLSNQSSVAAGRFMRRDQIIKSISPSYYPADYAAGIGPENDANVSAAAWKQTIDNYCDFINDRYGMPFALRTIMPKSSNVGNHRWSNTVDQVAEPDARIAANALITADPNFVFDFSNVAQGGLNDGKWTVDPTVYTLTADANAAQAHVFLDNNPGAGALLVFGDGNANIEVREVISVTGAGPFDCFCSGNFVTTRLAAETAISVYTDDGVHYNTLMAQQIAQHVATEKNVFV